MSSLLLLIDWFQTPDVPRRISDVPELRGPCGDLLQWFGIEPVEAMTAYATGGDQPATPQDRQML